jgi:TATA-box binding protein (TBP) (component of TFIID and TFIIIB)
MSLQPSAYKVSTITATGSLNSLIDLQVLYDNLEIVPYEEEDKMGFIFIEFGVRKADTIYRGFNKKLLTVNRKRKAKKRFDNQVTVILRMEEKDLPTQFVNVKVFKNGNVQMTGLKHVEQGHSVLNIVIDQIKSIQKNGQVVAETIDTIEKTNYKICLINSDFRMGIEIKRDKLNKLMQNEYRVYSSFEPCIYPGVKIQFCWNEDHTSKNGVCKCACECQGKGSGQGDGQCKKITIAVFQSGCIIITGAQTYEQIDDAYAFICNVVRTNMRHVHKIPIEIPLKTSSG